MPPLGEVVINNRPEKGEEQGQHGSRNQQPQ
jgi:hypothetical protein